MREKAARLWLFLPLAAGLAAGAGALLWPEASSRAPSVSARSAIVLAELDGAALAPKDAWLTPVLRRLIAAELEDAWGVEPGLGEPPGPPFPPDAGGRVERDDAGALHLQLTLPGARGPRATDLRASAPRALAREAARALAEGLASPEARLPSARDLAQSGTDDPAAWRDWRRARRAARMQQPGRVRALCRRAIERDPDFPLPYLEIAASYDPRDRARERPLARAEALAARRPGLHPLWPLVLELLRAEPDGDRRASGETFARLESLSPDLPDRDRLYVAALQARRAYRAGDFETSIPRLEEITDAWPKDAAAFKLMANHVLNQGPASAETALRYARRAAELAPHDAGARADLARALLASGARDEALRHARVVGRLVPKERVPVSGDAARHPVFALYMALGRPERAAQEARRARTGSQMERIHARWLSAQADLYRGAFDDGLAELARVERSYARVGRQRLASRARWHRAWNAFLLGRAGEARLALAGLSVEPYRERAEDLLALLPEGEEDVDPASRPPRSLAAGSPAAAYFAAEAEARAGRSEEAARRFAELTSRADAWTEPVIAARARARLGELGAR